MRPNHHNRSRPQVDAVHRTLSKFEQVETGGRIKQSAIDAAQDAEAVEGEVGAFKPAGFRQTRSTPIQDRIDHTVCSAALWLTIMR
jgi:hypothetical protein